MLLKWSAMLHFLLMPMTGGNF